MKAEFLKLAGVKTEKAFYKKYPTEAAFFKAHPEAKKMIKKAQGGLTTVPIQSSGMANISPQISAETLDLKPMANTSGGSGVENYVTGGSNILGGLIGGANTIKQKKLELENARTQEKLSRVIKDAAISNKFSEKPKNQYVRPEDIVFGPNQRSKSQGVGTNILTGQNGINLEGDEYYDLIDKYRGYDSMMRDIESRGPAPVVKKEEVVVSTPTQPKPSKKIDENSARDIWVEKTGLPWSEAKKRGYTDGSFNSNVNLLNRLRTEKLSSILDNPKPTSGGGNKKSNTQQKTSPVKGETSKNKTTQTKQKPITQTTKRMSDEEYRNYGSQLRALPETDFYDRTVELLAHPLEVYGHYAKYRELPAAGFSKGEGNAYDDVIGTRNPMYWLSKGLNAARYLGVGEYGKAAEEAVGALPALQHAKYTRYLPLNPGLPKNATVKPAGRLMQSSMKKLPGRQLPAERLPEGVLHYPKSGKLSLKDAKKIKGVSAKGMLELFKMVQDKDEKKIKKKYYGGEIQNTYAPDYLYDDLGYEPLNESEIVKQYAYGGGIPEAQNGIDQYGTEDTKLDWGMFSKSGKGFGQNNYNSFTKSMFNNNGGSQMGSAIGSMFGPLGGVVGGMIGGMADDTQSKINSTYARAKKNIDYAAGLDQTLGYLSEMGVARDGGQITNPQLITKFGEYSMDDLLVPPHDADMLRAGGHLSKYTPPTARAMYTGRDSSYKMQFGGSRPLNPYSYEDGSIEPLSPYNQEYMDSLAKEYLNLYYGDQPATGDGYDDFYHSKVDNLPMVKTTSSGWIISKPGTDMEEFIEDTGDNKAPTPKKNQVVTRVENYETSDVPTTDFNRITSHLQHQLYRGNKLKAGGNVSSYAMGGELKTHWGGGAETMSHNPYLPSNGETVMFRGKSHDESDGYGNTGIGITYGDSPVEVERGEPAIELQEPNGETNLTVFGNLKIPNAYIPILGDEKAKGKKFKNYVAELSKQEKRQNNIIEKSTSILDDLELNTSFDKLKMAAAEANILGANMKLKNIADKKINAAALQSLINDTAEEYGLDADALARGKAKVNPDAFDEYAKYGKTLTMQTTTPPKTTKKIRMKALDHVPKGQRKNASGTWGNVSMKDVVGMMRDNPWYDWDDFDPSSKPDVMDFQKEFNEKAKEVGSSARIHEDGALGEQTASARFDETSTTELENIPEAATIPAAPAEAKKDNVKEKEKTYKTIDYKRDPIADAMNQVISLMRPSDQEPFDTSQILGEMNAISTNRLEPIKAQSYIPNLLSRSNISLQDQLNANQADYRSAQRMVGYNPAAQVILNAQKYAANQGVLGEQFRMNQQADDELNAANTALINEANRFNLGVYDKQFERQSEALSNTKAIAQAALNSISDKYAKHKLDNRTLGIYENLYNYRFDPSGRAVNMNPLYQPNMPNVYGKYSNPDMIPVVDDKGNIIKYIQADSEEKTSATQRNGGKTKKNYSQSSIVRAFK